MTAPTGIEDVLALSPLQAGLFSLSEMAGDGLDVYSMQFVVEISGPLSVRTLQSSVAAILARHPNLRVSLWDQGVPHPVQIVPVDVVVPWREVTVTPTEFDELTRAERARPFDLRQGPAMRVVLARLPDAEQLNVRYRLIVTAHHILMDGWAVALFFRELLAIYGAGGHAGALPPVKPYRNYIAWLAQQDSVAALENWSQYLRDCPPLLLGAPGTPAIEPQRRRRTINAADTARILGWARSHGLTPATVSAFAWSVVLGRLADRDDVVFGTTISGRPQSLPGAGDMVGLFINTVPVRADLCAEPTVLEACVAMQRSAAQMRDLGFLGLADIARAAGTSTLFDTLFVYENAPIGSATDAVTAADGTRFLPLAMESLSHYPLTVVAYELDGELVVMTESVDDALGAIDAGQVIDRVIAVLQQLPGAADTPALTLDVLLDHEKAWATKPAIGDPLPAGTTAIGLFLDQVRATPDATALVADDGTWTYAQLHRWVCGVAAELQQAGVRRGSTVGLAAARSGRSVVGVLASMLAGAAYVPIDIALPDARIRNLLEQSEATVVLADGPHEAFGDRGVLTDWSVREADSYRRITVSPADAAYVIFTSGSTGEPKGVVGTQGALASYARDHRDRVLAVGRDRLQRPLRVAHAWTFSFDASWQPLAALLDGHEIHLFSEAETRDAARLVAALGEREIDMIDTTPSMFGQLDAAGLVSGEPGHPTLSILALGGEAIGPALWDRLGGLPRTAVFNCYGPTETTVEAMVAQVSSSPVPTIAGPTDRMTARVLDSRLRPVADGVIGELYLTGEQVTRGYIGRPGRTAVAFVADPFTPGARLYRTGDLVRRNAAGDIIFVGRGDDQVKIRGYRIEVGEVEAAMRTVPGVRAAAVVVVDRPIGAALVGFVAGGAAESEGLDAGEVRAELAQRLPSHMIPTRVIVLPGFPVNANGKLDSGVLGASARAALTGGGTDEVFDDGQERVADAVAGVLGTRPALDDDFFDLGMDSIVAMALVTALRTRGDDIAARDVMTFPNIRDLAAAVRRGERLARVVADREYGEVPALPVVEWMYEGGQWRRFTQTVLFRLPHELADSEAIAVLQAVIDGHDMLRSTRAGGTLTTREPGVVAAASRFWVVEQDPGQSIRDLVTLAARQANDAVDPDRGDMLAAVRIVTPEENLLLFAVHHLAVDAVSWQILFGDFAEAGAAIASGSALSLPPEFTDYRAFSGALLARAETDAVAAQRDYWRAQVSAPDPAIGDRRPEVGRDTWATLRSAPVLTDVEVTAQILAGVDQRVGMREFLLTALTATLASWRAERGQDPAAGSLIALEGHGREDATVGEELGGSEIDTGRTLGWFTTVFPVRLAAGGEVTVESLEADASTGDRLLESVAAELDYGLLRYREKDPELVGGVDPQVEFNYLGRFDLGVANDTPGPWQPIVDLELNEHLPTDPEPDLPLRYALDIVAVVRATPDGPQLVTNWRYCSTVLSESDVARLSSLWSRAVAALAG